MDFEDGRHAAGLGPEGCVGSEKRVSLESRLPIDADVG
jgi:hypothetical protein